MIRTFRATLKTAGANGSAAASASIGPVNGRLMGIRVQYSASQPATTDVVIATASAPTTSLLTLTNVNTSGWYYPRVPTHDTSGAALTYNGTQAVTEPVAVDDQVNITVAQGNDTETVTVTLLVEQ